MSTLYKSILSLATLLACSSMPAWGEDNETTCAHQPVYHEEIPARCLDDGRKAYWTCSICEKDFKDEACTEELDDMNELIIPALNIPYIGTLDNSANELAYCAFYENGGSQALYTASEMKNKAATITSFALYCTQTGALNRNIKVYMGHTSQKEITPSSYLTNLTNVYDGTMTLGTSSGWEVLNLDTPFEYNGTDNLVVGIYSYSKGYSNIYYACSTNGSAIYRWADNSECRGYADINNNEIEYEVGSRPSIFFNYDPNNMPGHEIDFSIVSTDGFAYCSVCGEKLQPTTLGTVALQDGIDYVRTSPCTVTRSLTYTRSFNIVNQWESLYLPLSFTYTEALARKCEIAEIHTYSYSDTDNGLIGSNSEKVILAQSIKIGSTVLANVPYLIRPKTIGEITFTSNDNKLYSAETTTLTCGMFREELTFAGNYFAKEDLTCDGCYAMLNGQLTKVTEEDEIVGPHRWYMTSSSSKTPATINIQSVHVHKDINSDSQCDICGCLLPLTTLVTEDNYNELDLTDDYIGYFYISTYKQLCAAMSMYSEGQNLNLVLVNDIVANESIFDTNGSLNPQLSYWVCIHLPEYCTFDGKGHTISGLYFEDNSIDYAGLFSSLGYYSTVKNVGITNSYFKGSNKPYTFMGSIAGYADNATISGCWADKTQLVGGTNFIGGIVGLADNGKIIDCRSSVDINSNNTEEYTDIHLNIGGIAGNISGTSILRSNFSGSLQNHNSASIGGIAGFASDPVSVYDEYHIDQCIAEGTISIASNVLGSVAGIVADVDFNDDNEELYLNITNCLNKITIVCPDNNSYAAGITEYVSHKAKINISSCLNAAEISSNNPIVDWVGGTANIENCFYLSQEDSDFNNVSTSYSCTTETLASGQIAVKLNGDKSDCWRQDLSTEDATPTPNQDKPLVYEGKNGSPFYVNEGGSRKELSLSDGNNYSCPVEYTAKTANYSRNLGSYEYASLCLPFSIDYNPDNEDYRLYYLAGTKTEGDNVTSITFRGFEKEVIPAGTPILAKALNGNTLTISEENTNVGTKALSLGESIMMKGTFAKYDPFVPTSLAPEASVYYLAEDQFWFADQEFLMNTYRAWIELPSSIGTAAMLRFFIEEDATSIQSIENKEESQESIIYNLSGQRQSALQKGIIIINNQKVFVK